MPGTFSVLTRAPKSRPQSKEAQRRGPSRPPCRPRLSHAPAAEAAQPHERAGGSITRSEASAGAKWNMTSECWRCGQNLASRTSQTDVAACQPFRMPLNGSRCGCLLRCCRPNQHTTGSLRGGAEVQANLGRRRAKPRQRPGPPEPEGDPTPEIKPPAQKARTSPDEAGPVRASLENPDKTRRDQTRTDKPRTVQTSLAQPRQGRHSPGMSR